jgi:16S rRNA (uracil1498-N3)-methyltransferase
MPANERMDWLVEKATELGAASIQPLLAERSVLRLAGERAAKKQAHWQGIAIAACEQSGRNRVPPVHPVQPLAAWLAAQPRAGVVLSLRPGTQPVAALAGRTELTLLSGPEGGLSPAEEDAALARGWQPVHLGPRVLRAETAPLAALARLTLGA